MNTTIQKWGNSQGLRLKKDILDTLNLSEGDSVKVFVRSGDIIVSPDKKQKKRVNLRKLLLRSRKQDGTKETDWGAPVGKEIW
ncbi:MAG: AbrB/MazE/SpoVT family DNA-binding domain-containing protein [bacterium]|nr:AbrB/MazE/SpoVT family DNA-binding domain-containing protein [bacterium]